MVYTTKKYSMSNDVPVNIIGSGANYSKPKQLSEQEKEDKQKEKNTIRIKLPEEKGKKKQVTRFRY